MSGSNHTPGLLAAPVVIASEVVQEHRRASPDTQAVNLAYLGGLIVGTGANLAINSIPNAQYFSISFKLCFVGAMIFGAALVVTGWRSRGGRNIWGAVKAILVPGVGFYLAATYMPSLFHVWWGQALCSGVIVANVVRVAICLASPSSRAYDLVAEDITDNEWRW